MGGEMGMALDLDLAPDLAALPPDVALFSESNGRFVVTVAERDTLAFEAIFGGLPCRRIGAVTATKSLRVTMGGTLRINLDIAAMKSAYKETLAHV
jgi:phosphoribosylformylglycinamidine synthase